MDRLDDRAPDSVQADRDTLRSHLSEVVPAKCLDDNLLIAQWELRSPRAVSFRCGDETFILMLPPRSGRSS